MIKFENINMQSLVDVATGVVFLLFVFKILDYISNLKPQAYPIFVNPPSKKRKDFTESTKKATVLQQWYICNDCRQSTQFWEFHHKDGVRSNNSPSNCEALCPNCHAEKTRIKKA